MKPTRPLLISLLLLAFLPPASVNAASRPPSFTLIYGNDVRGELAPCG